MYVCVFVFFLYFCSCVRFVSCIFFSCAYPCIYKKSERAERCLSPTVSMKNNNYNFACIVMCIVFYCIDQRRNISFYSHKYRYILHCIDARILYSLYNCTSYIDHGKNKYRRKTHTSHDIFFRRFLMSFRCFSVTMARK